jgi:hypothetical protein
VVLLGCGSRADIADVLRGLNDGGAGADATATPDAGSMQDATAIVDAGDIAEDDAAGTDWTSCAVPPTALGIGVGRASSCFVATAGVFEHAASRCRSAEYPMYCFATQAPPSSSLGCHGVMAVDGGVYYCCPCADAGPACVNVDLSTYDRSCSRDSECMTISTTGIACCIGSCSAAAINADSGARYWQAIAGLPSCGLSGCPNDQGPACIHGMCTYPRGSDPCPLCALTQPP